MKADPLTQGERAPQTGRWPVREHLRPIQVRRVYEPGDLSPHDLARWPDLLEELNSVIVHKRGPDGWEIMATPLAFALALSWSGEA